LTMKYSDTLSSEMEFNYSIKFPMVMNIISVIITIAIPLIIYFVFTTSIAFVSLVILFISTIGTTITTWPIRHSHILTNRGIILRHGLFVNLELRFEEILDVQPNDEQFRFPRPQYKNNKYYMITSTKNLVKISLTYPKSIWRFTKKVSEITINLDDPDFFIVQYQAKRSNYMSSIKKR
jgi:hypothetical protein